MTEAPKQHVVEEKKVVQTPSNEAEQAQAQQVHSAVKIDTALRETAAQHENASLKVTRVLEDQQAERRKRYGKALAIGLGVTALGIGAAVTGASFLPAEVFTNPSAVNPNTINAGAVAAVVLGEIAAGLGITAAIAGGVGRSANRRTRVPRMA